MLTNHSFKPIWANIVTRTRTRTSTNMKSAHGSKHSFFPHRNRVVVSDQPAQLQWGARCDLTATNQTKPPSPYPKAFLKFLTKLPLNNVSMSNEVHKTKQINKQRSTTEQLRYKSMKPGLAWLWLWLGASWLSKSKNKIWVFEWPWHFVPCVCVSIVIFLCVLRWSRSRATASVNFEVEETSWSEMIWLFSSDSSFINHPNISIKTYWTENCNEINCNLHCEAPKWRLVCMEAF